MKVLSARLVQRALGGLVAYAITGITRLAPSFEQLVDAFDSRKRELVPAIYHNVKSRLNKKGAPLHCRGQVLNCLRAVEKLIFRCLKGVFVATSTKQTVCKRTSSNHSVKTN